jgi:hypothetical protein
MPSESPLLTLQRRFLGALREPIFGDSRARSELPPRAGDVSAAFVETADALVRPSASMRPVERLELYHRQYWYRLLDSLAEDFPALRTFLGEEGFWSAAEDYLEAEPPRSFTLRHLGQGLADFLARTATGPDAVHAAELARLEWSLCVAFEAAEHTPVAPSELGHAPLALQPHVQLLALSSPADTTWRRGGRRRSPRRPSRRASPETSRRASRRFVAVFREGLEVRIERIPRAAFAILAALREHPRLTDAMAHVASTPGLFRARDVHRTEGWFRAWIARGWLTPGESSNHETH